MSDRRRSRLSFFSAMALAAVGCADSEGTAPEAGDATYRGGSSGRAEETAPVGASAERAVLRATYEPRPWPSALDLDGAMRFGPHGNRVFVLDMMNHRLIEMELRSGDILRQFGGAGQGPGELLVPVDFAVGGSGAVYVVTAGGRTSVHSFSQNGEFLNVIHQGTSPEDFDQFATLAIVVDSRDRIYLNQPELGAVMMRYSPKGEQEASIGELLDPNEVFTDCGEHALCRDPRFALRLNRVVTSKATEDDALVLAFTAVPVVRRYSTDGDLEFETRLESDFVSELVAAAMQDREVWRPYLSYNVDTDGVNALQMVQGVSVDTESGLVFCLVGGREIHVLSGAGDQLAVLQPSDAEEIDALWSMSAQGGVIWLTSHSKLYGADYPDELSGHVEGAATAR